MSNTPVQSTSDRRAAPEGADFGDQAAARLREAQAAMTDLLTRAGLGEARPTEVSKRLGLDKTLAWKIARFAEDQDPVRAVKHMPGPGGVEIVLTAASNHGVATSAIDGLRHADRRLREFVRTHAGDRRSFEAMLAGEERDAKLELEERRAFYRAGTTIWGVRAKLQFLMLALRPSKTDAGMLDVVQIGGFVGLERLRPDVPWIIRRLRATSDEGKSSYTVRREPLDPAGVTGTGLPLMPEFCTRPLPAVRQFENENGWVYDELSPGEVGRHGAVTCITGELYRSALPYRWAEDNTYGRYFLTLRTPVTGVLFDVLLHRDIPGWSHARAQSTGLLEDRPGGGGAGGGGPALSDDHPAQLLGSPPVIQSLRLGDYPAMATRAFELAGWADGLASFRGYRAEMDYPPAPSELAMRFEIERS